MRHFSSAVIGSLAALAAAAPTITKHAVHEKRSSSSEWVKLDRVHGDVIMPVRIGMSQSNLDRGHDMLMDVSHPESSNYGKHWSAEEVHDFFAPREETVSAVAEWLRDAGFDVSHSVNKQWMEFDAKTSELEELLKAKFHFHEHTPSGKASIATDEYSVPQHLTEHIDYVTPGIKLFAPKSKKPSPSEIEKRTAEMQKRTFLGGDDPLKPILHGLPMALEALLALPLLTLCDLAITPECIFEMYNLSKPTTSQEGNKLGIFEDLGDVYSQTDLNEFFLALVPQIPQGTHPELNAIDGAKAPNPVLSAGPESDLDFQISYPLIYPQNSVLFQTDDPVYEANYTYAGFLNNFLDGIDGSYCTYSAFGETGNSELDPSYPHDVPGGYNKPLQCGVYKPTNVISISYGGQEADLPVSYQKRQCNEFMKLGMQGVSVVLASGDSGVAGPDGSGSGNGCLGDGDIFSPDFPASCPYLTAVGGTTLPLLANVHEDQERATTRFPSGGGFSNIYPQPDYQKAAVGTYLSEHAPPYQSYSTVDNKTVGADGGIFNRNGRGYPDVSAVGDNIIIFTGGAPTLIGGTSASAPVFASILTRINEERLANGKGTVGFVNPTLYANPDALHDITVGSNPGCGTDGFAVAKGWDPVTGLGTPDYEKLLKLFG